MKKSILLTGAFGNIGHHTLHSLLKNGHHVVALDLETHHNRKVAGNLKGDVRVVWGDITDRDCVQSALEGVDAVVHLAALIPPITDKQPERARKINVDATVQLIELMEASNRARRLVFASSIAVFGCTQDREPPLRADTPLSPDDLYGQTKVDCERAIRSSGLQWSILRIAAAVPTDVLHYSSDMSVAFAASADARIEFVLPADAGLAFANTVDCDQCIGKTLYIGGGENCRLSEQQLMCEINQAMGLGPIPREAFVDAEIPTTYGDWVDTEESQRLLDFQHHDLKDFKREVRKILGARRYLFRLLRPFIMRKLLKQSHYYDQAGH